MTSGIGVGKKKYLRLEMGEGSMELMTVIKRALDAKNILNPGKVLDMPHDSEVEEIPWQESNARKNWKDRISRLHLIESSI